MQFFKGATFFLLTLGVSALPTAPNCVNPTATDVENRGTAVNPALVPVFKIQPGSGIGANNVPIPKDCPPSRAEFLQKLSANVAAGNVLGQKITFNTDIKVTDVKTQKDRATAMIITLQSLSGTKGVGCPGASTPELIEQQKTGIQSPA
ncbi:hypothetical protein HYFRA_00006749 [Hymenoscyphus fraxineus]|uniref:Uncharacterized protein n=1 Tax=Hymenoscyphus fraxineus TaxID=746836 RepID=A0A9N9PNR8_9HELO|nr:hypothetical protein HYFRA_00006749 [Hymenoscyphus fraxineus]